MESTNQLAGALLTDLLKQAPALVLTANQTAGRGRGRNQWWATSGAMTFSLVLNAASTGLPVEKQGLTAIVSGLAVARVIRATSSHLDTAIKWPNDVLINQKKVCGILVEQHPASTQTGIIIGVGINVNNSLQAAPREVQVRATSLYDETQQYFDMTQLLVEVLRQFEALQSRVACDAASVLQEVNDHSFLNGRHVAIDAGGREMCGICERIDTDGALVLKTEQGIQRLYGGSVTRW